MANTVFKRNEVIVLLGAGASVEAGILDSTSMVRAIESSVSGNDSNWARYQDLYRYIRSAIYYKEGLDGVFDDRVLFNIESLVNTLDEIRKKERHTLYPFVGAWNPKLIEVAGENFRNIGDFREAIVKKLRDDWIPLRMKELADYYSGLLRFQHEFEYPLRVFSLNYDLCVEIVCGRDNVQLGFDERRWDWRLFDETTDDAAPILLYKLHGSTDWLLNSEGRVALSDAPSTITERDVAMIFGTSYKLQYIDPFLFLAYEFRRWTLDDAKVVVSIGYGFGDEHINGILKQALRQVKQRKLLAVMGPGDDNFTQEERNRIVEILESGEDQIKVLAMGAKQFLTEELTTAYLANLFPEEADLMPELP